jgi:acetyl-CoA acetyltransferase
MKRSRPDFLGQVAIAGVGFTPFTRASGRTVLDLAAEACRSALADAGLPASEVDGVASFAFLGDSVPSHAVATALAAPKVSWILDMNMGGQAPCLLAMNAAMAIHSGLATSVLIYRALNGRSGMRVGSAALAGSSAQYRYPIGFNAYPLYVAMWARRYMIETGATEEDLAAVVMRQREHAAGNERALYREPLSLEAYLASSYVAEPFRIPDCAAEVDGACALLLTSLDRARSLRRTPAVIQGGAYARGRRSGLDTGDAMLWEDYSRNAMSHLADDLWSSAQLTARDIDIAEIYDCFSSSVLFALEGLGLAGRGEAGALTRSGATGPGGSLPVNTHGGLLCEGYIHGMNTLCEAVLQVQGQAGARQAPRADRCLVTSGALMDGSALVLTRDNAA